MAVDPMEIRETSTTRLTVAATLMGGAIAFVVYAQGQILPMHGV